MDLGGLQEYLNFLKNGAIAAIIGVVIGAVLLFYLAGIMGRIRRIERA